MDHMGIAVVNTKLFISKKLDKESWVIKNDRKKLDMDSADPQNRSEWRGRL